MFLFFFKQQVSDWINGKCHILEWSQAVIPELILPIQKSRWNRWQCGRGIWGSISHCHHQTNLRVSLEMIDQILLTMSAFLLLI